MARRPPFLSPEVLARLTGRVEYRIARELVLVLERVKADLPLTAVERALLEQNLNAAIDAIGLEPVQNALYGITDRTAGLRADAFHVEAGKLPANLRDREPIVRLTLGAYGGQHPFVLDAIARQSLARIREISVETTAAIRDFLTRALATGQPPRETARQVRTVIGLTRRQVTAVERFRARLVAEDRAPDQVDRMVDRYSRKQLRLRAENIAITETMTALEEGRQLQRQRLVRDGVIRADQWEQTWVTAEDERVCPICGPLHGATARIGEAFSQGGETQLQPPAHPRCRCVTTLALRGFRAGDRGSPARRAVLGR